MRLSGYLFTAAAAFGLILTVYAIPISDSISDPSDPLLSRLATRGQKYHESKSIIKVTFWDRENFLDCQEEHRSNALQHPITIHDTECDSEQKEKLESLIKKLIDEAHKAGALKDLRLKYAPDVQFTNNCLAQWVQFNLFRFAVRPGDAEKSGRCVSGEARLESQCHGLIVVTGHGTLTSDNSSNSIFYNNVKKDEEHHLPSDWSTLLWSSEPS